MQQNTHQHDTTAPGPQSPRVLVIGATGYVASRLIPALLDGGATVVAGARDTAKLQRFPWCDKVVAAKLDVFDRQSIEAATKSVDVAYYLVHSMDGDTFVERDHQAAVNIADIAGQSGVRRLVYLSGLIPADDSDLSDHLYSRHDVEQVLADSDVPVTVTLRAAIILGAGSASFEMLRQLTERVPFIPLPGWLNSLVQPISIADIVAQLVDAGLTAETSRSVDVGGPAVMRYADLIDTYCQVTGLRRKFIPIPLLPHRFIGAMATYFVDLPSALVTALVDSLGHDMVCRPDLRESVLGSTAVADAIRASLKPQGLSEDPHVLQDHDPGWAGGDIDIDIDSGDPHVTGAATGGTGWRSRRTALPVLAAATVIAVGITALNALLPSQPRDLPRPPATP